MGITFSNQVMRHTIKVQCISNKEKQKNCLVRICIKFVTALSLQFVRIMTIDRDYKTESANTSITNDQLLTTIIQLENQVWSEFGLSLRAVHG